jgi:hypothetical protein
VNLHGVVCPGAHYRQAIDGVTVRAPDGVHFPFFSMADPSTPDPDTLATVRRFGMWLGRTLWPKLLPGWLDRGTFAPAPRVSQRTHHR